MKKALNLFIFIIIFIFTIVFNAHIIIANADNSDDEKIMSLINEKLHCEQVNFHILYDFNLENRYVLVEGDNCYLIYDFYLHDYVEFSKTSKSIYTSINNRKNIYFLPSYYFYYYNNDFYELHENRILNNEEIIALKEKEKELISTFKNRKNNINNSKSGDVFINHSFYYENLTHNMSNNIDDSCSYISIEMILSYYDSFYNDQVIAEIYDANESNVFSNLSSLDISEYIESPGVNAYFHDYIIGYGRELLFTFSNSTYISMLSMPDFLNYYFAERNLTKIDYLAGLLENKYNFCKNGIDDNNPIIVGFFGRDTDIDDRYLNHYAVGYGYDNTGIYVNFGWQDTGYNCINIRNYTIDEAYYIEFTSNHFCSNNYLWNNTYCNGSVCPCGNILCSHNYIYNNSFDISGHEMICTFCNNIKNEMHNFRPSGLGYICETCSYFTRHPIIINGGDDYA